MGGSLFAFSGDELELPLLAATAADFGSLADVVCADDEALGIVTVDVAGLGLGEDEVIPEARRSGSWHGCLVRCVQCLESLLVRVAVAALKRPNVVVLVVIVSVNSRCVMRCVGDNLAALQRFYPPSSV